MSNFNPHKVLKALYAVNVNGKINADEQVSKFSLTELKILIETELDSLNPRRSVVIRLHQRFCTLRTQFEREKIRALKNPWTV